MSKVEHHDKDFFSVYAGSRPCESTVSDALRQLGLSSRGFLDVDKMAAALGFDTKENVASRCTITRNSGSD